MSKAGSDGGGGFVDDGGGFCRVVKMAVAVRIVGQLNLVAAPRVSIRRRDGDGGWGGSGAVIYHTYAGKTAVEGVS